MNLADWLKGDHEPSVRIKAVESLCRAVAESRGSLVLDPTRIQVAGDELRPEEGKGAPNGRYRPPETADGQTPSAQSQVYTVGVLCFEILSGRAFEARGGPLLRDLRPDLPRDLSDAVQACLEMDAEWRPKDVSYLRGLVETLGAAGGPPVSKPAARSGRSPAVPSPAPKMARRSSPAPRSGPLLVFALVALAVSLGIAVVRLRQPIEPPALPPAPSLPPPASPVARTVPANGGVVPTLPSRPPGVAPSPADTARRPGAASPGSVASPVPASVRTAPPASAPPAVPAGGRAGASASAAPAAASPTPVAAVLASVAPASAAPVASPAAGPVPATEPAGAAAVTNVSPPRLRRGGNVLVDVHGIGLRSDHQVRIGRAKEAARGIDVVRQRYVGPTLLQALLQVDAAAPPGPYLLFLVDGAGHATNPRPLEVVK